VHRTFQGFFRTLKQGRKAGYLLLAGSSRAGVLWLTAAIITRQFGVLACSARQQ